MLLHFSTYNNKIEVIRGAAVCCQNTDGACRSTEVKCLVKTEEGQRFTSSEVKPGFSTDDRLQNELRGILHFPLNYAAVITQSTQQKEDNLQGDVIWPTNKILN